MINFTIFYSFRVFCQESLGRVASSSASQICIWITFLIFIGQLQRILLIYLLLRPVSHRIIIFTGSDNTDSYYRKTFMLLHIQHCLGSGLQVFVIT